MKRENKQLQIEKASQLTEAQNNWGDPISAWTPTEVVKATPRKNKRGR